MQTEGGGGEWQINAATKLEIFFSILMRIGNKLHSTPFKLFHRDDIAFSWERANKTPAAESAVFMPYRGMKMFLLFRVARHFEDFKGFPEILENIISQCYASRKMKAIKMWKKNCKNIRNIEMSEANNLYVTINGVSSGTMKKMDALKRWSQESYAGFNPLSWDVYIF